MSSPNESKVDLKSYALQYNLDDTMLWNCWTEQASPPAPRVFFPNVHIPEERLELFLNFELCFSLAQADEPDEAWIQRFGRLLDKAYDYFGVKPTSEGVKKWLDRDVVTIVGIVATHPMGSKLHQFGALAGKLDRMQQAFPDAARLNNLKTLLINIAQSIKALPKKSLSDSSAEVVKLMSKDDDREAHLSMILHDQLNMGEASMELSSFLQPSTQQNLVGRSSSLITSLTSSSDAHQHVFERTRRGRGNVLQRAPHRP